MLSAHYLKNWVFVCIMYNILFVYVGEHIHQFLFAKNVGRKKKRIKNRFQNSSLCQKKWGGESCKNSMMLKLCNTATNFIRSGDVCIFHGEINRYMLVHSVFLV